MYIMIGSKLIYSDLLLFITLNNLYTPDNLLKLQYYKQLYHLLKTRSSELLMYNISFRKTQKNQIIIQAGSHIV